MKKFISIGILNFIIIQILSSQYRTDRKVEILFDSLTIDQLNNKELVLDQINSENKLIFLEYFINGFRKEYYSISDSTFYYRSYDGNRLYEEGNFIIDNLQFGETDTVKFLCEFDGIQISKRYHLLRHNYWRSIDNEGNLGHGKYEFGRKEGRWSEKDWRDNTLEIDYLNNNEIGRVNPNFEDLPEYIDVISNNPWFSHYESKDSLINELNTYGWKMIFNNEKYSYINSRCKVEFRKDGNFVITGLNSNMVVNESINGKWNIANSKLIINILDNAYIYEVKYISNKELSLLKIKDLR